MKPKSSQEPRPVFVVTEAASVKNYAEDRKVEAAERALRELYAKRAGRPINEFGWMWCAGCGAEKFAVDHPAAKLTRGRCAALCTSCKPGVRDFEALIWWRDRMDPAARQGLTLAGLCKSFSGRTVEIPIETIEAAAAAHLPLARATVDAMIASGGRWISQLDQAVLGLGDPADRELAARAVARMSPPPPAAAPVSAPAGEVSA